MSLDANGYLQIDLPAEQPPRNATWVGESLGQRDAEVDGAMMNVISYSAVNLDGEIVQVGDLHLPHTR